MLRVAVAVLTLTVLARLSQAQSTPPPGACRPDGKQQSGAIYRICLPSPGKANGDLVVFAHGYVDAFTPVGIPEDQLQLGDGTSIPALVNDLGFAFATTSYSRNGLAVVEGIADLVDLVNIYKTTVGIPKHVYLVGASEGGVITAKSIEMFPQVYSGGVAACGPVGDFPSQIDYLGDFRVIFDYFYPGVLPGDPIAVPQYLIDNWDKTYVPAIKNALAADKAKALRFINTANIPIFSNPVNLEDAVLSVAWYQIFGTNDARSQLSGQPFENKNRLYSGSSNDGLLNILVRRYSADSKAIETQKKNYQTTGMLTRPLITLHTLGDPIIPYWHETLYRKKVESAGRASLHINIPVLRYGHCSFNVGEVLTSFLLLLLKVGVEDVRSAQSHLQSEADRSAFRALAAANRSWLDARQ